MHHTGADNRLLKRNQERIFWVSLFNPEKDRAHSVRGFQVRLEQCLLVDIIN